MAERPGSISCHFCWEARVEFIEELVPEHEAYSRLVVGPMAPKCFEFRRDVKCPDFAKVLGVKSLKQIR